MSLSSLDRKSMEDALALYPGEVIPLPQNWLDDTFSDLEPERIQHLLVEIANFHIIGAKRFYEESIVSLLSDDDTYVRADAVADNLAAIGASFLQAALKY